MAFSPKLLQMGASGAGPANYIEEVFSTFLYTGNGTSQTITNSIDESGKGAMTWIKKRNAAEDHVLTDTVRGAGNTLFSNLTDANEYDITRLSAFTSSGFSIGGSSRVNQNANTFVSWTFREQPKFFDIVTYTGNGSARTIAHNLGSVPGCIIVKCTNQLTNWAVYHRSLGGTYITRLNTTGASETGYENWANTDPTSTVFTVGNGNATNGVDFTYVAYVFAHNAGGFGLTGTDNVISCGSYDGNGSTVSVNLGYEPQFIIAKKYGGTGNWFMVDVMRGSSMTYGSEAGGSLFANLSNAEDTSTYGRLFEPTATGFKVVNGAVTDTMIYIAIRRGPMKVPTVGTSVFSPVARTGTGTATSISGVGFVPDFFLSQNRNAPGDPGPASSLSIVLSRLTNLKFLRTQQTNAEGDSTEVTSWNQSGVSLSADTYGRVNDTSVNTINYFMGRAPSFMDVVCYTGTGADLVVNHNLQAVPELIILKYRQGTSYGWKVTATGLTNPNTYYLDLNSTNAESNYITNFIYNRTTTTFSVVGDLAQSGWNWVAYLFATCAGVSKVGSYTGTGTTLQVNCGFATGARFVMIKRTDDTGNWFVWDTARGIIAGNDPYLLLNSSAVEVTNTDYIDSYSPGFELSSTAPSAINASGGTFIFLAIA
jgi:hypothetical protein